MSGPSPLAALAAFARESHRQDALSASLEGFVEDAAPSAAEVRLLGELKRSRGVKTLAELCRKDVDTYVLSRFGPALRDRLAASLSAWVRRRFRPAGTARPAPGGDSERTKVAAPRADTRDRTARRAPEEPRHPLTTPDGVRAFVEQRKIGAFLSWPAPAAPATSAEAADVRPLTIEQVLLERSARPSGRGVTVLSPRQELAVAELQRFAENVGYLDKREDERRRRPAVAPGETATALAALLSHECNERAARFPPRPRGAYIPAPLRFRDHPPRLLFEEGRDTRAPVVLGYRPPDQVTIGLAGFARGRVEISCSCEAGERGCDHAVAGLDAALELLADPNAGAHTELIAVVGVAPWRRLVAHLDEALASRMRPPADGHLAWCVSADSDPGRAPRLEARLARVSADGLSFTERVPLRELEGRPELLRTQADARAAALARLGLDDGSGRGQGLSEPARVFRVLEALIGASNVHTGSGSRQKLEVKGGKLVAVFESGADGSVAVRVRIGERLYSADAVLRLAPDRRHLFHVDEDRGRCDLALIDRKWQALLDALLVCPEPMPAEGAEQLLRRLHLLQPEVAVDLPPELRGLTRPADPTIIFRLTPRQQGLAVELLVRPLGEGPVWLPGDGPEVILHEVAGRRVSLRRDLAGERDRTQHALVATGLIGHGEAARFHVEIEEEDRALDLVETLREGVEGVVAEWPEDAWKIRWVHRAHLRVHVEAEGDWFGLTGQAEIDGETIPLHALIEAMRRRRRYVVLGPQKFAFIEADLRSRLEAALDFVSPTRGGLEVAPTSAPALHDLVDDPARLTFADSVRASLERLEAARRREPTVPPGLRATLRPYQEAGFRWLSRLAAGGIGGCLADDMGLGKTLQVLAVLLERATEGPALVVAPTSVVSVWEREAARFAPGLRVRRYADAARRDALVDLAPGDLVLTSYGVVIRDAERLAAISFSTLVLDEAQAIKNARSARARAVRSLRATWRLALTGTPIENHLGELWSIFRIVSPAVLGGWDWFRERFAAPIERDRDPARRAALARIVRPFLLRRTKKEVAPELPPRTELQRLVDLSRGERRLYEEARLGTLAALGRLPVGDGRALAEERFQILAALTRLRLLACHPRLADDASPLPSSKLGALVELLTTLRETGRRALVFSQFTRLLDLAEPEIERTGLRFVRLDGSTPAEERDRLVQAFQEGGADVFLISLRAGGFGLTLTAADTVVHLDPWWNPAVEDQATDRTHRIGQERPVTVVRLITRGTVEEAVVAMHTRKRALAAAVLEGTGDASQIGSDELLALMTESASASALAEADDAGEQSPTENDPVGSVT